MTTRRHHLRSRSTAAGAAAAAASAGLALLAACSPGVSTIDRTQPNGIDKAQFEGIWYHRATVTSADPESGQVEGMTSNTEKLRWDITQELLIGYRSYEFVPYAEGLTSAGKDFFGAPVAAFKILKHFDIQRDYDPTTGAQNNVIVENDTDRPWYQRQYIRVDWTQNLVGTDTQFWIGWTNYPTGYYAGQAVASYFIQPNDPNNPDRPIFTRDYFDVTNVYSLNPDEFYCSMLLLYYNVARCGAGQAKVRLSFRKIDPSQDYQSLYYPDNLELHDDAGNAVVLNGDGRACDSSKNPGDCTIQTYPYDQQFGNFRTERTAFNEERGLTRTGRVYLAGRFNIWKQSYKSSDGSLIPYEQRTPVPIVYYGNTNMPDDMIDPAKNVASFWNQPLLETVAHLQKKLKADGSPDLDAVRAEVGGDMFVFKQNDCNIASVKAYAQAKKLTSAVETAIGGTIDTLARGNIERACAAMQFAELQAGKTLDPKDGRPMAFTWQRKGDLRYNFQNYVDPVDTNEPWGVAQFGQDPETGEFFSNTANYFGASGDLVSQAEVDVIQWMNGDLPQDRLQLGDETRKVVVSRIPTGNYKVNTRVQGLLMRHEDALIAGSRDKLFAATVPDADATRFKQMFGGSQIERDYLVNDDLLRAFAGPTLYQPFSQGANPAPAGTPGTSAASQLNPVTPGEISADALAKASPVSWGNSLDTNPYMKMVTELSKRAWDMADFFDPNTSGLAASFKGTSRDQINQFLRTQLYAAVEAHEVGHTLGLRHNFQASMDPLNYPREFWYKQNADGTVTQYWNQPSTPDNPNRGNEYKYASVMDYGFDTPLEGLHGIGAYDAAAVRFFYGQLVDVWDPAKVSIPDPRKYRSWSRRCGYNSDAYGLPGLLSWLSPESIPVIFSQKPVLNADGTPCAPIDSATGKENFDLSSKCDSPMDAIFREMVFRSEQTAQQLNDVSDCTLFYNISDLNSALVKVQKLLDATPDPSARAAALTQGAKNVYDARKVVPVQQLIDQTRAVLLTPPTYGDPADPSTLESENKGYPWSQFLHQVQYGYCSDQYAQYSFPGCQLWDTGWNFTQATEAHISRYDRDYVFDHFRRDRLNWGSPAAYMARLESRRLFHMVNVYRYYLFTRSSAFNAPLYDDWAAAAYKGLNFLERVLQTPEPGRYCLDAAQNNYRLDPTGTSTACGQPIEIGLGAGQGKFQQTTWTNEYYYKPNRIGTFYDKLAAIRLLTSSSGFFLRDVSDLFDRRAFSLGYLRVFDDPILQRFNSLIEGDFTGYRPAVLKDATGQPFVRYMPFFDEDDSGVVCRSDADCNGVPGMSCTGNAQTPGTCTGGSARQLLETEPTIEPSWSYTLQFMALAYGIANFSSINDYAPEYYRYTQVAPAGSKEDVSYPTNIQVTSFTDPESRIEYHAPVIPGTPPPGLVSPWPAYYGDAFHRAHGQFRPWGVGGDLLAKANDFVTRTYQPARAACPDETLNTAACAQLRSARQQLNDMVGFIDILRRFNHQAQSP